MAEELLQNLIIAREKYITVFLENEAREKTEREKNEILISAEEFLKKAKDNFRTVTFDESVYRRDRCQVGASPKCRNKGTVTYYVLGRASFCEKCFKSEYFWLNFEQSVLNGDYGDGYKTVYVWPGVDFKTDVKNGASAREVIEKRIDILEKMVKKEPDRFRNYLQHNPDCWVAVMDARGKSHSPTDIDVQLEASREKLEAWLLSEMDSRIVGPVTIARIARDITVHPTLDEAADAYRMGSSAGENSSFES